MKMLDDTESEDDDEVECEDGEVFEGSSHTPMGKKH